MQTQAHVKRKGGVAPVHMYEIQTQVQMQTQGNGHSFPLLVTALVLAFALTL